MPNRIIHEKALLSHTMGRLSDGAERLFWRLTVVADDHGRFDAHDITVKAKCFPTLVDTIKTSKVHAWLKELEIDHCIFYTVEGRPYGQFRNWAEYQRTYNQKSKFPEPPATSGEFPEIPALILNRESRIENRESRIENRWDEPTQAQARGSVDDALETVDRRRAETRDGARPTVDKATRTLDDFALTPELEAWSAKEGIADPSQYVEEFRDYWRSAGGKRKSGQAIKDWDAAFRNRLRALKDQGKLRKKPFDLAAWAREEPV